MIPILAQNYPYTGNGLGGLADAIECTVTHEVNGIYELQLRYPITGVNYAEIMPQYFIIAKPDQLTQAQPFRIYRITKPLNGVVTVYARHISYDMAGIVVEPFSSSSLTAALLALPDHCTPSTSFNFTTTKSVASAFSMSEPKELWRVLGGTQGSFLDVYGGEWDFDLLDATLRTRLGSDRGVKIRYGKNLTGLEQDATLESTYSGVYPYWYDEETNTLVEITGKYVPITGASVSGRLMLLDCTGDFTEQPTEQQLIDRATAYINANSVGSPKTSWKISFAMLAQAGEYEAQAALEQVALGDTLEVEYEALGVSASSRVVKIDYDVLKEQYKIVTVGRVKQNLAAIIVGQNQEMDSKIAAAKSDLERAVDKSTDFIRNGAGYMRLIYDGDTLKEIVSLDNPDIGLAQKVWRWNNGGFGFSSTGYNGTYGLALTQDGEIVADYITTGTLNANVIRAGIIADTQGYNSWNLQTGAFTIQNGSINITTNSQTYDAISLTYNEWTASMAPLQFVLENSSTKRKLQIQAGAIYGYTDYTQSTPKRDVLIDSSGSMWLGGGLYNGHLYFNNTSAITRAHIDGSTGNIALNNTSGTAMTTITPGTITLGGSGTSGAITVKDTGGVKTGQMSASGIYVYNGTNKYTFLMWPDANSAGRIVLGDGTGTVWRTSIQNDGITFRNSSNAQTAKYPASLTASRALVTSTNGLVAVSSVTSTELGYLSGASSAIQTQLNNKAGKATHGSSYHVQSITTANTYMNCVASIPANKFYVITAQTYYSAVSPAAVSIRTSSSSTAGAYFKAEGTADAAGTRAVVTICGMTGTTQENFYVWGRAKSSGDVGAAIETIYW